MTIGQRVVLSLFLCFVCSMLGVTGMVFVLNNEDLIPIQKIVGGALCCAGGLVATLFIDSVIMRPLKRIRRD